ncbi:unnamed protein product, partial [Brenthis ino]
MDQDRDHVERTSWTQKQRETKGKVEGRDRDRCNTQLVQPRKESRQVAISVGGLHPEREHVKPSVLRRHSHRSCRAVVPPEYESDRNRECTLCLRVHALHYNISCSWLVSMRLAAVAGIEIRRNTYRWLYMLCLSRVVKQFPLPKSGLLLRISGQKSSRTILGSTRNSNPGPPDLQPYMLTTRPPMQSNSLCPMHGGNYEIFACV